MADPQDGLRETARAWLRVRYPGTDPRAADSSVADLVAFAREQRQGVLAQAAHAAYDNFPGAVAARISDWLNGRARREADNG